MSCSSNRVVAAGGEANLQAIDRYDEAQVHHDRVADAQVPDDRGVAAEGVPEALGELLAAALLLAHCRGGVPAPAASMPCAGQLGAGVARGPILISF